jgi:hypothetical protein
MRATLWCFVALSLAGCPRDRLRENGCREDKDCGSPASAYRCETQTGVCYCRTDQACPGAQFCNTAGFCQDRSGCASNQDCTDGATYCDTASGQCVPKGRCTSDVQCELGQVCDLTRGSCVEGCRKDGDCPGTSCRCGEVACACTGTTPEELARCALGTCDPNFCSNESFCRFGEQCGVPEDAGVTRNQCFSDYDFDRRPYCARCTSGGGTDTCGRGPNFCIIDTRTNSTYCGADCSQGQTCPRGYGCRDIRVVFTRWQCSATQACPGDPALPCTTDGDCRRGGTCTKSPGATSGYCAGQCRLREGSNFGYCSCQVDEDCATESCSQGECTITRRKCVDDSQCRTIRCVDFDGVGACLIGQNCTPNNGLTCLEVQ